MFPKKQAKNFLLCSFCEAPYAKRKSLDTYKKNCISIKNFYKL